MSDYKLEFKLKQHTPIIHFQHNQHGASLRASELKPKLDKFILRKLGEEKLGANRTSDEYYEEGIKIAKQKKWLIGKGEHPALDYKVKVKAIEELDNYKMIVSQNRQQKWQTSYPTFFANMGKDNKDELVNFTLYKDVDIRAICFIEGLKDKIKELFADFLFVTNFGTRQSKGFGSFYLENTENLNSDIPYLKININQNINDVFNVINYYHQRLKSGVNLSYQKTDRNQHPIGIRFCHYKEAFIKIYLRNIRANYIWDKKWLKEKYFPLPIDTNEKRFVRALLGLSYDFDFKTIENLCNPNGTLPRNRTKVSIEIDINDEIQRIKSPILYKPIKTGNEWRIYITQVSHL
jgi:CRISPR/Cas system CMR-associated protein Cmr1 (group 7 of RAMP superfamily)